MQIPSDSQRWQRELAPRRFRLHHLYFLLATFELLIIAVSFGLTHSILAVFANSIVTNEQFGIRLERFVALGELAAAVDTPGNNVFETRDIPHEMQELEQAVERFQQQLRSAREEVVASADSSLARPILEAMQCLDDFVQQIEGQARQIFAQLAAGDEARAGALMAVMDRERDQSLRVAGQLCRMVRGLETQAFERDVAQADAYAIWQSVILTSAVLVVVGVVAYGRGLARRIARADRELSERSAIVQSSEDAIVESDMSDETIPWNQGRQGSDARPAGEPAIGVIANHRGDGFGR